MNYARMCNGEYCHFPNWMESLKSLLMFHFNSCTGAVNYYLLINCDGLPFSGILLITNYIQYLFHCLVSACAHFVLGSIALNSLSKEKSHILLFFETIFGRYPNFIG